MSLHYACGGDATRDARPFTDPAERYQYEGALPREGGRVRNSDFGKARD
ncbi:MAG: hypothetical protein JNJ73_16630 [Hyphomonadaceae bacterium]|nr:hypothetical protein [Hyphomonadaceae bacterium]